MHPALSPSRVDSLSLDVFHGYQVDMLRDDLIHPLIAGNKWRKLSGIIEHAKTIENAHIVTFGGAYSNHLVATAVAGKLFGIKTSAFVRGDEERPLNAYEETCRSYGMQLIHVSRTSYRDKTQLFNQYFEDQANTLKVDEGGRHSLAFKGCKAILDDLHKVYDYIVLSVGTGTTMEGLIQGCIQKQLNTKIIGISSLKNNFELDQIMGKYPNQYWQIFHEFHRGKYAKFDADLLEFIDQFKQSSKIALEPVYTGKMMMALTELIEQGCFKKEAKILCIHTGGLPELMPIYNP